MHIKLRAYRFYLVSVFFIISALFLGLYNANHVYGETSFTCGVSSVQDIDGNTYGTTQVGDQCWMTENLKVGSMVLGGVEQTDNGVVEKYCYGNDPLNCETDGGLYQWDEAMQYSTLEGSQGICPVGWHVPTDDEWLVLEQEFTNPGVICGKDDRDANGWGCYGAGTALKQGGLSGLDFIPSGQYSYEFMSFLHGREQTPILQGSYMWTSTPASLENAWLRHINFASYLTGTSRFNHSKTLGQSIRCIQDTSSIDLCSNIVGAQTEVPVGLEAIDGECVAIAEPALSVDITAPASLSTTTNAYSPNPFTVTLTISNDGEGAAENAEATLILPLGLSLAGGSLVQEFGEIEVGGERSISWDVVAEPRYVETTLEYAVRVSTDGMSPLIARKEITIPVFCAVSPAGIDTCGLQEGDIVLIHSVSALSIVEAQLFDGYWSHAGIYNGDGTFTESYPENVLSRLPGVVINQASTSLFWDESVKDWSVLRVGSLSETQQSNAVAYAKSKADGNHLYNLWFPNKETEDKFYCSQLVWRAYERQGVDLDSNFSAFSTKVKHWMTSMGPATGSGVVKSAVPPDDIYFSPFVTNVEDRGGIKRSVGRWVFRLLSPATILVIDEQGRRTGFDPETQSVLQEIPGSFYKGKDADPQSITFSDMSEGTFKVLITGTGTGEYTFLAESIDKESHFILEAPGEITPGETDEYEFSNVEEEGEPTITQIVDIDVKPYTRIAPVNLKSRGVLPVAILSSEGFDATDVDPETVVFGPGAAASSRSHFVDVNRDGLRDLMLFFKTQEVGLSKGDTEVCLGGETGEGVRIEGCANVRTVGKWSFFYVKHLFKNQK
jgi:uncharacterized protein (TIGR02145 family)